jgi:uncharacterized protein YuzE
MTELQIALPDLVVELEATLSTKGRNDIGAQLREVELIRWTYDDSCDAVYLYLRSPRTLNIVDEKIIGTKHGETVSLYTELRINLDTDNHGRLSGIEILGAKEVISKLGEVVV